MLLKGKANQSR